MDLVYIMLLKLLCKNTKKTENPQIFFPKMWENPQIFAVRH